MMSWPLMRIRWKACAAGGMLALIVAWGVSASAQAPAVDDQLLGAASDRHLWLVLDPSEEQQVFDLVHHPSEQAKWHYRPQHAMSQPPAAIAAWDDRVWMVQPPRTTGDHWQREVYSTQVLRNAATGLYYASPIGRLEMAVALEGLGRLGGLVATAAGPVVLLLPSQQASVTVTRTGGGATSPVLGRPRLLRLVAGDREWSEIRLPQGFTGQRQSMIAGIGPENAGLVLLEAASDNPARSMVFFRQPDGVWLGSSHPLDLRLVRSVLNVAGQALAVVDDRAGGAVDLAYIRPNGLLSLAKIRRPTSPWTALAFGGGISIIEHERGSQEPRLTVRSIHALTGLAAAPEAFTRQPATAGQLWQLTLALGLSLSTVLALVLLRPAAGNAVGVPVARVLPPGRRVAAGLIDLAVGVIPAMVLLDCTLRDLVVLPMITFDFAKAGPYVVCAVVAGAVATALETITARSLGKMLVGGCVTSISGSRTAWRMILWRGAVRMVVALVPPLAVFALTNPHMRGLHDMAAKTLVLATDRTEPSRST